MDRSFAWLAVAILATLTLCQVCATTAAAAEPGAADTCDPVDGPRRRWTAAEKASTRARVQAACRRLGAAPIVCAYDDAVLSRESFGGAASVRHTRGQDADGTPEHGLGPMGLSLRWHGAKWGPDADPAFCVPEVSVVVAHAIYHRAVSRYGADSIADVQAVFAGRFRCSSVDRWRWLARAPLLGHLWARWLPGPVRECRLAPTARSEADICERMRRRGYSCHARITAADLGRPLDSPAERRAWVGERIGRDG